MSDLELTMMRRVGELNKEVARLKANVERLTKAGDAIIQNLHPEEGDWCFEDAEATWNAAKEGKGQP